MILSEKLKKLRIENELTQKELAKKLKCLDIQISKYESGKVMPSPEILIKIADLFGVTVDYLIRENINELAKDKIADSDLLNQFQKTNSLDNKTKNLIKEVIEAIIIKSQLKQIV